IEAAGTGDLIRFSPLFDRAQTITLNGTSLVVSRALTIAGPGAARLTVSGAGLSRVILTGNNVALSLSGVTITGGRVAENGGGIKSQGPLSLRNVAVAGNRVEGSTGGGRDQIVGMANIVGCTFSDNHAGTSGAIDFELAGGSATLRIANNTVRGNPADGEVGAIDVFNPAAGLASVEIVDSTIAGNRAAVEGGILLYTQGTPDAKIDLTLRNTILANTLPTNLDKGGAAGGPITVASRGYNLTNDAASDDLADATDQLGVDPRLGPLNNNGGQTET